MVNEREPPARPPSQQPNIHIDARQAAPEFGKPSLSPLPQKSRQFNDRDPNANLFHVRRPGEKRPEHHRPIQHNPLAAARDWARDPVHRVADPQSQAKSQLPNFDPYRAQGIGTSWRAPALAPKPDDDVVEISRPASYQTWTTKPAPPPMFSSRQTLGHNYMDLTRSSPINPLGPNNLNDGSTLSDPSIYLDAGKANENLKALLEGAFEDEEDKPRTRSRKKHLDQAAEDLADRLKGLDVKGSEVAEEESEEDDGTVEGLKVKLLPHQVEGVDWMRGKETGTKKTRGVHPRGGILADDMGLGKTIQSIALILTNPFPKDYVKDPPPEQGTGKPEKNKNKLPYGLDRGTMVVAPLALIKQWEAEIKDRVEDSHTLRVLVHHGPQRTKRATDLKKYDVVITTYQILVSEHSASGGNLNVGVFGVNWYRVILDEAHTIKNRNAKATQAAYALNSQYRWCLTGTPMQNNLDELQSLIRFLQIKPYDDLSTWRDQITRPMNNGRGGLAIRRLQVYLKAFMKRRTKDILKQEGALRNGPTGKTEDGKPTGFRIVKRTVEKVEAEFTSDERHFYDRLEQRTDRSLEQMMKGSKLSYASALVLLLRLRQACNHSQLVKSDLAQEKETFNNTDSPRKKAAVRDEDIDSIADMLGGLSVQTKRCDVCQIELSAKESSSGAVRCRECEIDLADDETAARTLRKEKKTKKKAKKAIVLDSDDESAAEKGEENVGSEDPEDEDIKPRIQKKKAMVGPVPDEEDDEDTSQSETDSNSDETDQNDDQLFSAEEQRSQKLVMSTKIRHLLQILRRDAHQHKYIIFSFFTSMLDLIEPFLRRNNLAFTRYDGGMRNDLREASLDRLRNHAGTRILLCSLRAGSLGLNLTAASRVVILEPFWNPFVEEQAIDRVHRLNQTQDVIVYKMTIKDTVEARILDLQERKRELANATIEGNKNAAAKLTLNDMLALFRHDAEHSAKVDGIGMKEPRQLLTGGGDNLNQEHGTAASGEQRRRGAQDPRRRVTPPKQAEDSVYGRRW